MPMHNGQENAYPLNLNGSVPHRQAKALNVLGARTMKMFQKESVCDKYINSFRI